MGQVPLLGRRLVEELGARWRAVHAPVVDRLRPGLADAELDALMEPLGLRLPMEARVWWGWHDGVEATSVRLSREREIMPALEFHPLAEAVDRCWTWRRISRGWHDDAPGEQPDPWWDDAWFPITDAGQAGIVACDCSVAAGEPTPIRCVLPPEPGSPTAEPVFASLGELVQGMIDAFDAGAWRYEEGWQLAAGPRPEVDRRLFGPWP